jgi:hypothetical protein
MRETFTSVVKDGVKQKTSYLMMESETCRRKLMTGHCGQASAKDESLSLGILLFAPSGFQLSTFHFLLSAGTVLYALALLV